MSESKCKICPARRMMPGPCFVVEVHGRGSMTGRTTRKQGQDLGAHLAPPQEGRIRVAAGEAALHIQAPAAEEPAGGGGRHQQLTTETHAAQGHDALLQATLLLALDLYLPFALAPWTKYFQ